MANKIDYIGVSAAKAMYRRCKFRMDSFEVANRDIVSRLDAIEREATNVVRIADEDIDDIMANKSIITY